MKRCPHCECAIDDNPKGVPRSPEQLRRYFAMLRAVRYYWPDTYELSFSNLTEFRKWIQMKVGYRTVGAKVPITRMPKEQAMFLAEASIRGAKAHSVVEIHGDDLVVFNPDSISYPLMKHHDFCKLNNKVDEFIRAETGLDPEQCLYEYKMLNLEQKRSKQKVSA